MRLSSGQLIMFNNSSEYCLDCKYRFNCVLDKIDLAEHTGRFVGNNQCMDALIITEMAGVSVMRIKNGHGHVFPLTWTTYLANCFSLPDDVLKKTNWYTYVMDGHPDMLRGVAHVCAYLDLSIHIGTLIKKVDNSPNGEIVFQYLAYGNFAMIDLQMMMVKIIAKLFNYELCQDIELLDVIVNAVNGCFPENPPTRYCV